MARVFTTSELNFVDIAALAGSSRVPHFIPTVDDGSAGFLEVSDVSQSELEAAIAGYDHLAEIKRRKIGEIRAAYAAAFSKGFSSSALGSSHFYHSDPGSLFKLLGAVESDEDGPFECTEIVTGNLVLVVHTAAQLKQVLRDGRAAALSYKQHERDLITQIESIVVSAEMTQEQAIAAVRAIVW